MYEVGLSCNIWFTIRPEKCPEYLYTLMCKCHTHEASERPTFGDILNILANEQTQYEKITTSVPVAYDHEVPLDANDN